RLQPLIHTPIGRNEATVLVEPGRMRRVAHRQQEGTRLVGQEIIEVVEGGPVRLRIRFEADLPRPAEAELHCMGSHQSSDLLVDVEHVITHGEDLGGRCWEQARHREAADTLANILGHVYCTLYS